MKKKVIGSAFLSAFLMGTIGIFSRMTGLPAEIITFFRLFLGAVFMALFLLSIKQLQHLKKRPPYSVLTCGLFLSGFIIFYVQAMNYTSMANAIMLVYLAPVAASIFAHFFLKEKLTARAMIFISMALFGFFLIMEMSFNLIKNSEEMTGLCYGTAALCCYAGFILTNRVIPKTTHPYHSAFYQLLAGSIAILPFCFPMFGNLSPETIPWLIGIGFFPGFLAILFAVLALRELPTAVFGTIAYAEPVTVVIIGWSLFQESLSAMQLCGVFLIIASGISRTITSH